MLRFQGGGQLSAMQVASKSDGLNDGQESRLDGNQGRAEDRDQDKRLSGQEIGRYTSRETFPAGLVLLRN